MRLNLAQTRRVFSDTGPFKSLTEAELELFVDGDTTVSGVPVAGETLAIICDLGARYRLDELIYYREAATLESVTIFGKQGTAVDYLWEEVSFSGVGNVLTVDLASLSDRYEFVKVVHDVSLGTATVYEIEVFTQDGEILFGETGQETAFSVDSGTDTLTPERVTVWNPDDTTHTFKILLEGEDEDSAGLSIGLTSSGAFDALYESGLAVPDDFDWPNGLFVNTEEQNDTVILTAGQTSGFYYSPVMDISSLSGRRLFWKSTTSGTSEIDEQASVDSISSIGVRFSNTMPTEPGWISGQLSIDSLWAISSGTLSFDPYDNNHILNPQYFNYFQVRLEFFGETSSQTPILEKVGIEQALSIDIAPQEFGEFYVKSSHGDHTVGREAALLTWYFERRNEEQ